MNIFDLRERVIEDYRSFTGAFVEPRDERNRAFLDDQLAEGAQWPDPWLSLNPMFASGGTPAELVARGLLHPECERIFRVKEHPGDQGRRPIVFHRHQRDAIEAAASGQSYVLTTGTGSGKSLGYIVPVVDRVLRERPTAGPGVKAIIVYPMNALANSQVLELEKFLNYGYGTEDRPVTFARYTGQEKPDERRRILADPPDILLTNYVMLDLVLTRPDERRHLIAAARGLRFLVLDELHTYRGRQGADVAMLVRRVRDACEAPDVQVVGTSATMASGGTSGQRREVVARVASRLFGSLVTPDRVIGETLVRATTGRADDAAVLADRVRQIAAGDEQAAGDRTYDQLVSDPLAAWVESAFGLEIEGEGAVERAAADGSEDRNQVPATGVGVDGEAWSGGRAASGILVRRPPVRLPDAAVELAGITGVDKDVCRRALETVLLVGSRARHPEHGRPLFAFRLHQFVSKGDSVYASVEPAATRYVTGRYQLRVPGAVEKALLPLGFCRECGQEYYVVAHVERGAEVAFVPRSDRDASGGDTVTGYLYLSDDHPWPEDPVAEGRLPDHWLVEDDHGAISIAASKAKYLPTRVHLAADGTITGAGEGMRAWFMSTPFAFCLRCRVSYEQVRGSDFSKLATLDQEGRSSAVTVLSASVVRALRRFGPDALDPKARKLLTFVDNRQDASLQAGHFNDFAQVGQLRGALCHALAATPGGLTHEAVAQQVTASLGLDLADFAANPQAKFSAKEAAERALRGVIEYRLYADLKRGWRVTMPNLEQVGLLHVRYADLAEIAADTETWAGVHPALEAAGAGLREELARTLLDEMRRVLAIDVDCLTDLGYERVQRDARQHLREPWVIADGERMEPVGTAFPKPGGRGGARSDLNLSGRSAFGRYLRRPGVLGSGLRPDDALAVIADLMGRLAQVGTLAETATDGNGVPGYRLKASAVRWVLGDGTRGADDPLRKQLDVDAVARVNPFFRDLYRDVGLGLAGLHAKEHTAQVPPDIREDREAAFREGDLPLLYCSPTMELGVDIASLEHGCHAQRPADPGELRAALRPGGAVRTAGVRRHLLRERQRPRQLLVPAQPGHGVGCGAAAAAGSGQRGPGALARAWDLVGRDRPVDEGEPDRRGRRRRGTAEPGVPARGVEGVDR